MKSNDTSLPPTNSGVAITQDLRQILLSSMALALILFSTSLFLVFATKRISNKNRRTLTQNEWISRIHNSLAVLQSQYFQLTSKQADYSGNILPSRSAILKRQMNLSHKYFDQNSQEFRSLYQSEILNFNRAYVRELHLSTFKERFTIMSQLSQIRKSLNEIRKNVVHPSQLDSITQYYNNTVDQLASYGFDLVLPTGETVTMQGVLFLSDISNHEIPATASLIDRLKISPYSNNTFKAKIEPLGSN